MDNVHRTHTAADTDATVPLKFLTEFQQESLRWPPHLDREAIVHRLVAIRESAPLYRDRLPELTRLLYDVESMPAVQIAASVLAALSWADENPGYGFLAEQLQIVAVNLKNLQED